MRYNVKLSDRLTVSMPDGSVWAVKVNIIARNRAAYYAHEYGNDVERSLKDDTEPLFSSESEVIDWAENNMNWEDVKESAVRIGIPHVDYQDGWVNGRKSISNV